MARNNQGEKGTGPDFAAAERRMPKAAIESIGPSSSARPLYAKPPLTEKVAIAATTRPRSPRRVVTNASRPAFGVSASRHSFPIRSHAQADTRSAAEGKRVSDRV